MRLGAPPYLAARPCLEGLDADPRFEIVLRSPSELVAALRAKELDAALVSSIEAFQRPGYRFVEGIGIVAPREVRSVLLFSKRPLADCQSLALDRASRAGAALARIVLAERARGPVKLVERESSADAWLRIGDAALREAHALVKSPRPGVEAHDLAALWNGLTGLPFVFALWLVRPGADVPPGAAEALAAARDRGVVRADALADDAARRLELPRAALASYLREACAYNLDPHALAGLREFHRRASALGLADAGVEPRPLESRSH
jgi:chorismate dehydratase